MSNKILQRIIKNKRGGTVLMLTMLILSSILVVSLVSADIIINGLKSSRIQNYSTIAFFAAEAGAERILNDIRRDRFDIAACPSPSQFCFDAISNGNIDQCIAPAGTCTNFDQQDLTNTAVFKLEYEQTGQWTDLASTGSYNDTNRVIKVSYCTPVCAGVNCGVDDGCGSGDNCPPWCTTNLGCQGAAPANSVVVDFGSCCVGDCYDCVGGFAWDGSDCVDSTYCGDGIAQSPNSVPFDESCDGTSPLGGNQECALDCDAIGYGFYMENNTSIDMDNAYFTATNIALDETEVDVTCKPGRIIDDVYGVCETGNITCTAGAIGTDYCRIGCTLDPLPDNESYYQFTCR